MKWWYGIVFNSAFFAVMWALSTKYLNESAQFKLQIIVLPIVYLINVWYGKSVKLASINGTAYFIVALASIGTTAILSLIFSFLILNQKTTILQALGGVLVLIGAVIMNL